MAITTAIARAASNIVPGNQDITDASFGGGTPKACIVIWNECITTGTAIDGQRFSYGFATGVSNQGCTSGNAEHNDVLSGDYRGQSEFDRVINGNAFGGSGDYCNGAFVAFITNGIRINWVDAPAIASLMTVVLFGGDDLQAHADNYVMGADTTVNDITAPGFQPQLIFSMGQNNNAAGTQRISRGIIWDEPSVGIKQHSWSQYSLNGANPTDISAALFQAGGLVFKFRTSASVDFGLVYSDFDAQGFTTTTSGNGAGTNNVYLALSFGANNKVFFDTFTTLDRLGRNAETVGFKPQLVMLTMQENVTAFDVQTRGGTRGWTVFNETSEFCESSSDEDGVDATIGGTNTQSLSSARALEVPAGDGVLSLEADLVSLDDVGYTLNYTNIPATQRAYLQVAIEQDGELDPIETYVPKAILFDGTTDWMNRVTNLTGVVDGKQGTTSFWLRLDILDLVNRQTIFLTDPGDKFVVQFLPDNTLRINGRNTAADIVLRLDTTKVFGVDTYVHLLAAWDLAAGVSFVYINDVLEPLLTETLVDDLIEYAASTPGWSIGAQTGPINFLPAGVSDLYFSTEFLDISSEANRQKFIDRDGNPVYLGDTGELPTGTAAAIYMRGHQTDQGTNAGTGGDFVSQAVQVPDETTGPVTPSPGNAPVPYTPEAILFDGTTDALLRGADLTTIADGKEGTVSFWLRLDGGDAALQVLFANLVTTNKVLVQREATNLIRFIARNAAGTDIVNMVTVATYVTSVTYVHVLAAWDLAATTVLLFVDDVADIAAVPTATDDVIDYGGATEWSVGADTSAGNKMTGALSDFYFSTTFIDISLEANRRLFIDSNGDPVFLGDDGTVPTTSFPAVYLPGTFLNQGKNTGFGGDFTSQGVQAPGETPGPVVPVAVDAEDAMRHLSRRSGRFHRFFRG